MRVRPIRRLATVSCLLLILCLADLVPAVADDWPTWRGPGFDGISSAENLPTEWSREINVRWRLEMPGAGASTPIVRGGRIYLTSAVKDSEELVVMAVDLAGKPVWTKPVTSAAFSFRGRGQFALETNPASPSPVSDGERLVTLFGNGVLAAFDLDGNELWRVDLVERYGELRLFFGLSATPFLHDGRLYLQLLNTNAQTVVALAALNGEEVWKHERQTDAEKECLHSYASVLVAEIGGQDQLLVHGADYITGHSLADGAELWRHGAINPRDGYNPSLRLVATPVWADGLLVVPTAKRGPVFGLKPGGALGDITGSEKHLAWKLERGTPDVPSPLVHGGLVYLSGERGTLTVLDAGSGEEVYAERVHESTHRGSPVYADGKIFLVATDGTVSVIKPGREFEILAKNSVDERLAASPVIVGDTIYLRGYEALYAIGNP